MRYLKNRNDGFIYEYNEQLAKHPLCYEVSEQEAFPERFVAQVAATPAAAAAVARTRTKKSLGDNLATADIPTPPTGNQDLNNDASRNLPPIAGAAVAPAAPAAPDIDLDSLMKM